MTKAKNNSYFLNYLKAEKISLDTDEFKFQLETHPEYPSLLAFHDALSFFNIPNITVKIDDKDISKLPDYFIAEAQSRLAFIIRKGIGFQVSYGDGKNHDYSAEEFQNIWSGVVLVAESEIEPTVKTKFNTNLLVGLLSIIFAIAIGPFSIFLSVFSLLIFFGLFFSIESVKKDLNVESDFSNKFCNISIETDCNSIINSKALKLFNYLSLSDMSIVFFIGQLFSLFIFLLLGFEKDYLIFSLAVLFLSIPILLASIYYQWRIAKKWCIICLGIITVLVVQLLFCTFYPHEIDLLNFNYQIKPIFLFLGSFLVSLFGWLIVKSILSSYFDLRSENKKLFKFKRNYTLFKKALISERKVDCQNLQSNLFIGKKDAKLIITVVTNPLCKYCKETHFVVNDLIKKYSDQIRINIFFNIKPKEGELNEPEDGELNELEDGELKEMDNIKNLHIKLVDIYFNKNQESFLEALGDWFMNKNYDKWFNKYGEISNNREDCMSLLRKQHQQNINNKVQFTPSMFIGEFSYPIMYDKEDILLYLNDLSEDADILTKRF